MLAREKLQFINYKVYIVYQLGKDATDAKYFLTMTNENKGDRQVFTIIYGRCLANHCENVLNNIIKPSKLFEYENRLLKGYFQIIFRLA